MSAQSWQSQTTFFHEQQTTPHSTHSNQVHFHLLTHSCPLLLFLFYILASDPMPPNPHLQHARQLLVNELPPEHDLRKRVKHDGNGELLPEQPAGRPRAPLREPPLRKRGRDLGDPSIVLERRYLMTMWNDQYHLKEEWARVHDKMSENRKKLGLRERPYKESDSRKRSREGSPDKSSDRNRDTAASVARKRRKKDCDTGERNSDEEQPKKKRNRAPEVWIWDKVAYQTLSPFGRDRKTAKEPHDFLTSSDKEPPVGETHRSKSTQPQKDRSLSRSPLKTISKIAGVPDSPPVVSDIMPRTRFPTVAEVLAPIPASGISMRSITELFWDRINGNMDKFYMLLQDNTNIDVDKSLIQRRRVLFGNGPVTGPKADTGSTCEDDQDSVLESMAISTRDTSSVYFHYIYGNAVQKGAQQLGIRLLARRGGLDMNRNGRRLMPTKRTRGKWCADDIRL